LPLLVVGALASSQPRRQQGEQDSWAPRIESRSAASEYPAVGRRVYLRFPPNSIADYEWIADAVAASKFFDIIAGLPLGQQFADGLGRKLSRFTLVAVIPSAFESIFSFRHSEHTRYKHR
jgi:hypothetical protein